MRIDKHYDTATLDDAELQIVLKAYIEQQTGRTVRGDVSIVVRPMNRLGVVREELYNAYCTLEDEPKEGAPWPRSCT